MSVINTNITSMIGQQNLNKSQNDLQTSMERLSSGLRINSAKDDAAGQAIANRMSAQITGLSTAQRNANDGISVAQTAEGALNQVNDNLQRIRELAVQAENGTNSSNDLESIQNEINQRLGEIDRISDETSFNDTKVLQSDQGMKIQVGANDGEAITIDLKEINVASLGMEGFNVTGAGEIDNTSATEEDLKLADNVAVSAGPGDYTLQVDNTAATASDVLGKLAANDTVILQDDGTDTAITDATQAGFASGTITGTFVADGEGNFTTDVNAYAEADTVNLITGDADGPTQATYTTGGGSQDILVDSEGNITNTEGTQLYLTATNELTTNDGDAGTVAATATNLSEAIADDVSGAGNLSLAIDGGPTINSDTTADQVTLSGASLTSTQLTNLAADNGNEIETAAIQVDAENVVMRADGTVQTKTATDTIYLDENEALTSDATTDTELFVNDNGKVTDSAANQYYLDQEGELTTEAVTEAERSSLADVDGALASVDSLRSDLGAIQNRMESAIENLSTTETNLSAARSRIEDADYAVEVANMTKNQILQQAGTSVLAQANQLPQNVLSLLG